jgi:hypothetical protein
MDSDGKDWVPIVDPKDEGKRSIMKTKTRQTYRCDAKFEPIDGYCDEKLQDLFSREEQLEYLNNVPGVVSTNRLIYNRQDHTMDKDEKAMLPKSRDLNIPIKNMLDFVVKEKVYETNFTTLDPDTGDFVYDNTATTARRREQ